MNNITTFFTTQHLNEGLLTAKANKLVLEGGGDLHIVSVTSISSLRKKGYTEVDSLDKIAETLEKLDWKGLNDQESETLLENYQWIHQKIESHNSKIDHKISLRFLHNIIKFFSRGKHGLKYEHTLEPQIRDIQKHLIFNSLPIEEKMEVISQLTEDQKVKRLLIVDESFLAHYFDQTSFLEEYKLQGLTIDQAKLQITTDQKQLLVRLLQLKHNRTVQEIQNFPLLRELVRDELKTYFESRGFQSGEQAVVDALAAIDEFRTLISHENLLQILIFIRENHDLMIAGTIGRQGRNRPEVRKIKATQYKVPVTLEYTPGSDDVVVKLEGILGTGTFKVVKKLLPLSRLVQELPRQAISKQPKTELAMHEREMMEAASGLPNVMTLDQVREYRSYKTGEEKLVFVTPLYNMGELEDRMLSTAFTQTQKLRITADILRGVVGLHSRHILHRDIKPANIFLYKTIEKGNEVIRAVVGDLGLACLTENDEHLNRYAGTPVFMPPEVLSGKAVADYSGDAWALGLTLSELFTGILSFPSARTQTDFYKAGLALESDPRPVDINSIEYVMWKLKRPNPAERMTPQEALTIVERLLASAENDPQSTVS